MEPGSGLHAVDAVSMFISEFGQTTLSPRRRSKETNGSNWRISTCALVHATSLATTFVPETLEPSRARETMRVIIAGPLDRFVGTLKG